MARRTREVSRENYVCANGGSAANTATELSRLGRKVTMVGGIGTDDLGNIALRGLIKAGVNIDHVIRRSDWKTGCAAIIQWQTARAY
jgi:ribokinase